MVQRLFCQLEGWKIKLETEAPNVLRFNRPEGLVKWTLDKRNQ